MNRTIEKSIYVILGIGILICVGSFILAFRQQSVSTQTENWGQFGDYIGGFLNPLVAILNVIVTIQIAKAVSVFSEQQSHHQASVQKELVRTQLLHEILRDFRRDILNAFDAIDQSLKEDDSAKLKPALETASSVIDGFIKYHQSLFSFPPGIALSIATDYNKWLALRNQGLYDKEDYGQRALKNKIEIDLMLSLLYGSIIEEAKLPEPKPITEEILAEWEKKLGVKKTNENE